MTKELFPTARNRAAQAWLVKRLATLKAKKASVNPNARKFSPEYAVLSRIVKFPFDKYPDYTIPSHLLSWPHMRWEHVFFVCTIIETLNQAKGGSVGKPLKMMPFQVLIVLLFLGPENPKTHLRLIREGLMTISKKNAKTTLIAAMVTALMVLDKANHGMHGQEIYVGASDREQAGITFDIVNKFILQDTTLGISDMFRLVPSRKNMIHLHTLTEFRVLSSDAFRAHGLNPAVVIFDEVGNVPGGLADEFYAVLTMGYGAQLEPLTLLMSTQAPSDTHLFSQMVDRTKRVNSGDETADDFCGFVFETPDEIGGEKLDPHDEKYWYLSNPGLGIAPSLADMRAESKKALALPSLESKFRNLRLNQRANPYSPLLSKSAWQTCSGGVDYEALFGRKCWGALDLSSVRDLTAFVLIFEPDEDGVTDVIPYFWLPSQGLEEKQRQDKVPYVTWASQGFLNTDAGKTIDYSLVAAQIDVCISDYDVQAIGFDRWKIKDLQAKLRERGLGEIVDDEAFMRPIGQGFKDASGCVEAVERAVINGRLRHGDHPVLTWCAANTITVSDPAGNRKFDKVKSYGRIDGIVSLAMALRVRELCEQTEDEGPSAFETAEDCLM